MRARAAACLRPSGPLAAASRLPRPSASQPARRLRSQCQSPSRMPYRSMEPGTAGTPQPRLGTTWDDLRRPTRPLGSVAAASLSVPSRPSKPVTVGRFNGVSGRFETSQTSTKRPRSDSLQRRYASGSTSPRGHSNRVLRRFHTLLMSPGSMSLGQLAIQPDAMCDSK